MFMLQYHISICFDPQGTFIKETNQSNRAWNRISLFQKQLTLYKTVGLLKRRLSFVEYLYKCDWSWYTVSCRQLTYLTKVNTVLLNKAHIGCTSSSCTLTQLLQHCQVGISVTNFFNFAVTVNTTERGCVFLLVQHVST